MPAKKSKNKKASIPLLGDIKDLVVSGVTAKVEHYKTHIKKELTVLGLFGLGILFLLRAVAEYLEQHAGVSQGTGFLLVGAVLVVIGLIYRAGAKE